MPLPLLVMAHLYILDPAWQLWIVKMSYTNLNQKGGSGGLTSGDRCEILLVSEEILGTQPTR